MAKKPKKEETSKPKAKKATKAKAAEPKTAKAAAKAQEATSKPQAQANPAPNGEAPNGASAGHDVQPMLRILAQYTKDVSFENPTAPDSLRNGLEAPKFNIGIETVSYTHLTLPTTPYV